MQILANDYPTVLRGVTERTVANERRANDDERAAITDHVERFLAGKLKATKFVRLCEFDPGRMEIMEHSRGEVDSKTKRVRYVHRPVKIERKHVLAAKLHRRDRLTLLDEDADGNLVEPFVSVVLSDGSRIELPYEHEAEPADVEGASPLQHPLMRLDVERLRTIANKLGIAKWRDLNHEELLQAIAEVDLGEPDPLAALRKDELLALAVKHGVKPPTGKNLESLSKAQLIGELGKLGVTGAAA